MKIAMVSEHASPLAVLGGVDAGGQNVHVAALARAMANMGAEVGVYTRRDDRALPERVRFTDGVVVHHIDAGPPTEIAKDKLLVHMDDFSDQLLHAWRQDTPDVVHAHFWMSGRASLPATRTLRVPMVQTFHALGIEKRRHQGPKDTSPPSRLREEQSIMRQAERIVATASAEAFELVRQGADKDRITVVPCGVDLDLFTPDGPRHPRTPGVYRILVLSRLVERKGISDVIEALRLLPNAELLIAGGPTSASLAQDFEARRLEQIAQDMGLGERVHFLGRVGREEIPSLLRSADVVACVPWYEPFGMVPLEAMACGIPVVASSVGGLIDTVVDGVTGFHVASRSPIALAGAVRSLLENNELRMHFGQAGRRRAVRRYGWNRIANDTLDVYGQVLAEYRTGMKKQTRAFTN